VVGLNQEMRKDYYYEIQFMIEETNRVLVSGGIKPIQENEDFVEGELSYERYAVFTTVKNENECIELRLEFGSGGVDSRHKRFLRGSFNSL